MAFQEGSRRIQIVGKLITLAGLGLMSLYFALPSVRDFLFEFLTRFGFLYASMLIGLMLWALGWILQGYGKNTFTDEKPREPASRVKS